MASGGKSKAQGRKRNSADDDGLFERLQSAAKELVLGPDAGKPSSDHAQEIKGLLLIGFSVWLLIAILSYWQGYDGSGARGSNWGGRVGYYFAGWALASAGIAGLLISWLCGCWGAILVARKNVNSPAIRLAGGVAFVLAIAFMLEMVFGRSVEPSNRLPYGIGGWLAMSVTPLLHDKFGGPGLWILMPLVALVSFMLATEMAFYPALVAFREWYEKRHAERGETLGQAAGGWIRQLFLGLWDFLRGARLGESAEKLRASAEAKVAPAAAAAVAELERELEAEMAVKPSGGSSIAVEEEVEELEDETPDPRAAARGDDEQDDERHDDEGAERDEEREDELVPAPAAKRTVSKLGKKARLAKAAQERPTPPAGPWKLPPLDLLEAPERDVTTDGRMLQEAARKLENALKSFRVEAGVVGAQVGPTVILFELEVAQGTRLNKVTQLSQEIAAALRAQSVRIIAPIPGKATIGIEVPNLQRRKVRISELVSQRAYDTKSIALPMFLGMDVEGNAIVDDLAKMPHLLIAGTTGSGKSVCINTVLASLLLTRSPHDVQMILIDPKMVELQMFASIPHLMVPVVTDMRHATNVLAWAVDKMEGRYELFNRANVRNIKIYNSLSEDELRTRMGAEWHEERTPRHVPYIVIVIDEFADLMMASKKEAEQAITRLAQKSRAVGIHVILATQRPSTDVITGVIKGNLPTRIAFQVASKVDSRVILDAMGAEKLLGGGDMLYNPPQTSKIKRVQGALVEDHELQALIDFVCKESAPNFSQELIQAATGTAQPGQASGFESALEDDLWDEAVRVILKSKRGSASLLQRALGIGYTRASRLLDMMAEAGIVSDHKGSKAREVLMTLEQWEAEHGAPTEPAAEGVKDE